MEEVWRDIPGYEGAYQVSTLGRVRSLDRVVSRVNKDGSVIQQQLKGRVLRQTNNHRVPYLTVTLSPGWKSARVHKIVAAAFLGDCPDGMEICHIDGNCFNNSVANLRYGTHEENVADMVKHGTRQRQCKFTENEIRDVRNRIAAGETDADIAKAYGVSERTVFRIRHRKVYKWVV